MVFHLNPRDLSMVSAAGDTQIADGEYRLFVGGAQPADTTSGVDATFRVQGTLRLPE